MRQTNALVGLCVVLSVLGTTQALARPHKKQPSIVQQTSFTTSSLVATVRRYFGTNPTGKGSYWCGDFMNFALEKAGFKRNPSNTALSFQHYGRRIAGPQVGAIAVMYRKGKDASGKRQGGHVGVVVAIDANGNPVIASGNHGKTVGQGVYPRDRIAAYVMPGR